MKVKVKIFKDPEESESKEQVEQEQPQEKAHEPEVCGLDTWDFHKENIQPLPQGRKIQELLGSLPLVCASNKFRRQVFDERRAKFEQERNECDGDLSKQLDLWHEYIDWLEQNTPDGGKVNGCTDAIEQCIEFYYDKKEFKQDERLFDIFMKFKRYCDEPIEIFGFMYANSICTLLAQLYLNWSWQYEIRKNMKRAMDLLKLGLRNLASPRELLIEAESQLKLRIVRMVRNGELSTVIEPPGSAIAGNNALQLTEGGEGIREALQTLKFSMTKKQGAKVSICRIGSTIDSANIGGLRSQSRIVNGVRVPVRPAASSSSRPRSNEPVRVFVEDENGGSYVDKSDGVKIPTSQRIRTVGRLGPENNAPRAGRLN